MRDFRAHGAPEIANKFNINLSLMNKTERSKKCVANHQHRLAASIHLFHQLRQIRCKIKQPPRSDAEYRWISANYSNAGSTLANYIFEHIFTAVMLYARLVFRTHLIENYSDGFTCTLVHTVSGLSSAATNSSFLCANKGSTRQIGCDNSALQLLKKYLMLMLIEEKRFNGFRLKSLILLHHVYELRLTNGRREPAKTTTTSQTYSARTTNTPTIRYKRKLWPLFLGSATSRLTVSTIVKRHTVTSHILLRY